MGLMRVLCDQGDVIVQWDPADKDSVAQAKDEFAKLKSDGYEFYESSGGPVTKDTQAKRVTTFKKSLGSVIAAPGVKTKSDVASTGTAKPSRPRAMAGQPNDRPIAFR